MDTWVLLIVAGLALCLVLVGLGLLALARQLRDFKASQSQPDQGLLLIKQDIEASRSEMKQELHQFAAQVASQMGQVGSGVQQQLQHVSQVVGNVQGSLGTLNEATKRVAEVGKDIAGLEQILKSPKFRGGLGETLLEQLLAQNFHGAYYALQHAFKSGEKVDAVIRIGGRLVPVDAKFPLENFRRMLEETEDEGRRGFRKAFARDVKNRVDEIAKKYILPDEGTFDFALMYVPAENVYYEMIAKSDEEDEPIAAYALSRRVVPVSPNSFYAYLQVIVLGLRGLRIEARALEIQSDLARLGGDLEKVKEHFGKLGAHLANAKRQFDDAERDLLRFEDKLGAIERKGEQSALPAPDA